MKGVKMIEILSDNDNTKWGFLGEYCDVELILNFANGYHKILRGVQKRTREKVIIHLYDLKPVPGNPPKSLYEEDYNVIKSFQKFSWCPRLRDPLHRISGDNDKEYILFTVFPNDAPSIEQLTNDPNWKQPDRFELAYNLITAINNMRPLKNSFSPNL